MPVGLRGSGVLLRRRRAATRRLCLVLEECWRENASGRTEASECLGPPRRAWQRLGVGARLVWAVLEGASAKSERPREGLQQGHPRRLLGRRRRGLPVGGPQRERPRRPRSAAWASAWRGAYSLALLRFYPGRAQISIELPSRCRWLCLAVFSRAAKRVHHRWRTSWRTS